MSDIFSVVGIAIIASVSAIFLRQYKPEYAFGITFCSGIIILMFSLLKFSDIADKLEDFISMAKIEEEHYKIIFKCFGTCILTKIASETCKDFGQESISSKIDLFGKLSILVFASPLFYEILSIIYSIMEIK